MARRWNIRKRDEVQMAVVYVAGRPFARGMTYTVLEGDAGWEEIVGSPLLEATEIREPSARRGAGGRRAPREKGSRRAAAESPDADKEA